MMKPHDSYRTFLLMLLAYMVSFPLLEQAGLIGKTVQMMLGLGVLWVGLIITRVDRKRIVMSGFILAVVFSLWVAEVIRPGGVQISIVREAIFLTVFSRIIFVMGKHVFVSPKVSTGDRLYGAISIYLLMSGFFSNIYMLMVLLNPSAFSCSVALCGQDVLTAFRNGANMYFSTITITTVGYGDITPTTALGGMLAAIEALIGQMYVAVVVARLVGLHLLESGTAK